MSKVKSRFINVFVSIMLLFAAGKMYAAQDPVQLIEHITSTVMQELKANKSQLERNPQAVYGIVDDVVLPYVDFTEMAVWIAGKSAWHAADANEQNTFIEEFKLLLLRTYATALNKYTNETIEVYRPKQNSATSGRIQISSKVIRANQENIRIDYRLLRRGSEWRLYDVIIEGVSILKGFQAQFSQDIKHNGLEYVTKQIRQRNMQREHGKK